MVWDLNELTPARTIEVALAEPDSANAISPVSPRGITTNAYLTPVNSATPTDAKPFPLSRRAAA